MFTKEESVLKRIKVLSNTFRFKIITLTQHKTLTIKELSTLLPLSYNKVVDYVALLYKHDLVEKINHGKYVKIKSLVVLQKHSSNSVSLRLRV